MVLSGEKISVIIPVYNAEMYLNECLNSVTQQNYKNIEIILINDGSTDNSLEICNYFKEKDDRIVVIDNENHGVSHARNCGLKAATGDFIAFVDSDDKVDKEIYSSMISECKLNNSDLVICGYHKENFKGNWHDVICDSHFLLKGKNELADFISKHYLKTTNEIWNKLYKKKIIDSSFDENVNTGEDLLFNIDYFKNCSTVSYIPKAMYYYRFGSKPSLTTRFDKRRYELNKIQNQKLSEFLLTYLPTADLTDIHSEFLKKSFRYFQRVSCSKELKYRDKKQLILTVCNDDYFKTVFNQIEKLSKFDRILKYLILGKNAMIIVSVLKISTYFKFIISK